MCAVCRVHDSCTAWLPSDHIRPSAKMRAPCLPRGVLVCIAWTERITRADRFWADLSSGLKCLACARQSVHRSDEMDVLCTCMPSKYQGCTTTDRCRSTIAAGNTVSGISRQRTVSDRSTRSEGQSVVDAETMKKSLWQSRSDHCPQPANPLASRGSHPHASRC